LIYKQAKQLNSGLIRHSGDIVSIAGPSSLILVLFQLHFGSRWSTLYWQT